MKRHPIEQRGGFIQSPLQAPQFPQARDRLRLEDRTLGEQLGGRHQLSLGIAPLAPLGQHSRVMRPAHRGHGAEPVTLAVLLHPRAPLACAVEVPHPLAGVDHETASQPDQIQLAHLAPKGGRGRLIELAHPPGQLTRGHQRGPLDRQRKHLQVEKPEPPRQLAPRRRVRLRRGGIVIPQEREQAFLHRQQRMLRTLLQVRQQPAHSLDPAVVDRLLAALSSLPRQRTRQARGARRVASLAAQPVGALPCLHRRIKIVEQETRPPQALKRLPRLARGKRRLELGPRPRPIPPVQRSPTRRQAIH